MIKPGDEPVPGYRVEEFLGRGRFGQVWRANAPGNTLVALKFIELTGLHGWKEFRAIQRVKQIRHAHLMPIVALWLLDGEGSIVSDEVVDDLAANESTQAILSTQGIAATETVTAASEKRLGDPTLMIVANLLASHSLGDRLSAAQDEGLRGIPRDELLAYITEAAKALDFLNLTNHKIGDSEGSIQHCDVKPDNILIMGGSVVLADWGVAQVLASQQESFTATSLGGTPAYMPPENFKNAPSPNSDQYSLAVTYYQLRTGQLPFPEETYAAVLDAHRNESLDFSLVSAQEQQVLRRATSNDPNQRFSACAEFVAALRTPSVQSVENAAPRSNSSWLVRLVTAAALVAFAFVLIASVAWLVNEEPSARVVIDVVPPDATLLVNGEPFSLDAFGTGVLEKLPLGQSVSISASKPGERNPVSVEISPAQKEEHHRIELPYSADYHAGIAEKMLEQNDFDGAVEAFKSALKVDPATYSRVPTPQLSLMAEGDDSITTLEFSRDASWILCGTKQGVLRSFAIDNGELTNGKLEHQLDARIQKIAAHREWVAAMSSLGERIWLASTDRLSAGFELTLPDKAGRIVDFEITGDGRWLVAAVEDFLLGDDDDLTNHALSLVFAWDLKAQDVAASRRKIFSWDKEIEATLAVGSTEPWFIISTYATAKDSCFVRQCWVEGLRDTRLYEAQGEKRRIAVGMQDQLLAVGGRRKESELGEQCVTLVELDAPASAQELPWGHTSLAFLGWGATGECLVSTDGSDEVHVWRIPRTFDMEQAESLAPTFLRIENRKGSQTRHLARDGLRCFGTGWVLCHYDRGQLSLWNSNEEKPQPMDLVSGLERILAVEVSANGEWIAVGGTGKAGTPGVVGIWSTRKLRLLKRACVETGVAPKAEQSSLSDRITARDFPSQRSLWENNETAFVSLHRPSVTLA